jgi:protein-ribulosamine 3-kinase
MIAGEFRCAQELRSRVPASTPDAVAWGSLGLVRGLEAYFLILDFVPFADESDALPDVAETAALVAALHKANAAVRDCPTVFGTVLPTYDGIFCHMSGWEPSWTKCFSKLLSRAYHFNCLTNGVDRELQIAYELVQCVVLPRLLGRLESGGHTITPYFIHGDLWEGNIQRHKETGKLYIFDSNGFYAHHEMELACWRTEHHKMHDRSFCDAYFAINPPSAPVHEVDDRLKLYALKAYLMYSAHARGHPSRAK